MTYDYNCALESKKRVKMCDLVKAIQKLFLQDATFIIKEVHK